MTKYIAWFLHSLALIRITSVRERKNMKTQMNTNIETLEYLDNIGDYNIKAYQRCQT